MRIKNKKGFTLIELIVVIAILGILALFLVPSFLGYTKDAQKATCDANRNLIERAYSFYKIRNDEVTLSEYIENGGSIYKDTQCPSGGIYTYDDVNEKVLCSIHDNEINDSEKPKDDLDENTKEKIPGTDLDIDSSSIVKYKKGQNVGTLKKGTLMEITDEKGTTIGYYIVRYQTWEDSLNPNNSSLVKITDEKALVVNGNNQSALNDALGINRSIGTKIQYNGKYYISIETIDKNYPQLPGTGDHWLEIK